MKRGRTSAFSPIRGVVKRTKTRTPPIGLDESAPEDESSDNSLPSPPRRRERLKPVAVLSPHVHNHDNFGRYRMSYSEVKTIFVSQQSKVVLCKHRLGGQQVVVKHLKLASKFGDPTPEATALASIGDWNIVRYLESWVEGDTLLIATEFCRGGAVIPTESALQETSQWPRWGETDLVTLARHVAHGLCRLHTRGLAHVDVKPPNIFVAKRCFPHGSNAVEAEVLYKLGDFGRCVGYDSKNKEGDFDYMPREVEDGQCDLRCVDVFSLGATLLQLGNGKPFQKEEAHFAEPNRFSLSFSQLVEKMTHDDPTQRPTAEEITVHPSIALGGQTQVPPKPTGHVPVTAAQRIAWRKKQHRLNLD